MRKKQTEKSEKPTLRERFADEFDASKEVILDVVKVVLLGSREAVIENYNGIVEYTAEKIVLEANPRGIRVLGKNMEIRSVTREMIIISGKIENVGFVKEG